MINISDLINPPKQISIKDLYVNLNEDNMETKKYPSIKEFRVGDILYHVTNRDINPFRILEMCETDVDWVKINDHFNFYIHDSESHLSWDDAFTTMDEAKECLLKRLDEKLLKLTEDLNETSNIILRIKSKQPYEEKSI